MQLLGCDMTRSALAKIEVGQRMLCPDEIKALRTALSVTYDDILLERRIDAATDTVIAVARFETLVETVAASQLRADS